jgi:hypothetical protein
MVRVWNFTFSLFEDYEELCAMKLGQIVQNLRQLCSEKMFRDLLGNYQSCFANLKSSLRANSTHRVKRAKLLARAAFVGGSDSMRFSHFENGPVASFGELVL